VSDIIAHGASKFNILLPPETEAAFGVYYSLLNEFGENINLTSISGVENVAALHFLDSLALLTVVPFENLKVIDIGSGAGFPGLPLKLAEPSIALTLLDATKKRVNFLQTISNKLGIKAECMHIRAEDAAHLDKMREQFDICVSRAVAKLNILCELCLPFVKPGGLFLAMKSVNSDDELELAKNAVSTLGARLQESVDYQIPDTDVVHRVIVFQKLLKTPDCYPRKFAKIRKSPL